LNEQINNDLAEQQIDERFDKGLTYAMRI